LSKTDKDNLRVCGESQQNFVRCRCPTLAVEHKSSIATQDVVRILAHH